MRSKLRDRLLRVVVATAILATLIAGALYLRRPLEWVQRLIDANPAWDVREVPNSQLAVTERSSGTHLLVPMSEAGTYALQRVPCERMLKSAPPWFRPPPAAEGTPPPTCVLLSADEHETYVGNFRTALEVPGVWDDYYAPLIRDYPYDVTGGKTGKALTYTVRPHADDPHDAAMWALPGGGRATVVAVFRKRAR